MLSTCSANSTNGRDILIGRISDETFADPKAKSATDGNIRKIIDSENGFVSVVSPWMLLLMILIPITIARPAMASMVRKLIRYRRR